MKKKCKRCEELKDLSCFHERPRYKQGVYTLCIPCEAEKSREWKKNHPDYVKRNKREYTENNRVKLKYYHIKRKWGMSPEEYDEFIKDGCVVCGDREHLHVDHDHNTGKIRECLCIRCNHALGALKENTVIMQRLIDYVNKHGGIY